MNRAILAPVLAPLLAVCTANVAGARQLEPSLSTITVSASASVDRAPDQVVIEFAVETEARSAQNASDANRVEAVTFTLADPDATRLEALARAATFEARGAPTTTPIEPGAIEARATVTVVFAIGRL